MFHYELLIVFSIIGFATVLGCAGSQRPESQDQLVARAKTEVLAGDAILLDVREEDEWKESHLQHARLVPTSVISNDSQRESGLEGIDKTKKIYTHCKKGGRAKACADVLQSLGYQVVPLEVSYETLVTAGFPTAQ